MELNKLNEQKMRIVEIVTSPPSVSFSNTAFEDGGELYKIEGGMIWVKQMPLLRAPFGKLEAKWKSVVSEEEADKILIKTYYGNEILSEYSLKVNTSVMNRRQY